MTSTIAEIRFKKADIGETPEHWEVVRSGQLYSERKEPGIPGLPVMSVTLERGLVPRSSLNRRVESDLEAREHALVRKGDLVYNTMRMWQGASGVAETDCLVSPAYVVAAPNNQLLPEFASFLFKSPMIIRLLYSHSHGITRDRLRLYFDNFEEVPIPLPPLTEQQKIAAILSSVDDAITATRKVIEQTKRVKQGLLETLMTRGIGHTQFRKTEIGEIPMEWEVVKLSHLVENGIRNGYSPNCPDSPTGRWVLSLGALTPEGLQVEERKPAPEDDEKVCQFLLKPGDLLISRSSTRERVGWSAMFRGEVENCAFPDLMMQFRVRSENVLPEYVEGYLFSKRALRHLQRRAAGTSGSMVKISQAVIRDLPVALPPRREQQEIVGALASARERLEAERSAESHLRKVKRGVMQDLLTGRVRVPLD